MENEKRKERGERGGEEEERSDGCRGVVCKGLESRGHERREERRENSKRRQFDRQKRGYHNHHCGLEVGGVAVWTKEVIL